MNKALLKSERQDWNTPSQIVELLGPVGLDPCSNKESIVSARVSWCLSDKALQLELELAAHKKAKNKPAIRETERLLDQELADLQCPNGLRDSWCGYGRVYVNPPYGAALKAWAQKIEMEVRRGCNIVALVPSRTDTGWFRRLWHVRSAVCFVAGRLTFLGAPDPAPFPSAVFCFGDHVAFRRSFSDLGILI